MNFKGGLVSSRSVTPSHGGRRRPARARTFRADDLFLPGSGRLTGDIRASGQPPQDSLQRPPPP